MKKQISYLVSFLLVIVLLLPGVVLASTWEYYIPIKVSNNGTVDYGNFTVLVDINSTQLAELGYINSDGLDTDMQEGATSREYMVGSSKVGMFVPSLLEGQSRTYNYRLGVSPEQTGFPIIVGPGGNVTVSDDASLELGDNFTIEIDGFVDTSGGSNRTLVHKEAAFKAYVPTSGTINATIITQDTPTTTIIRPSGVGTYTEIEGIYGAPTHWEAVDEDPPDDAGTCVYQTNLGTFRDTYQLQDPNIPEDSLINSVTVYFRIYTNAAAPITGVKPILCLAGSLEEGTLIDVPTSWTTYSETLDRPGGGPWKLGDLAGLEGGISIYSGADSVTRYCTQVYVEINYSPPIYTEVTATGVDTGEHVVEIAADGTDLKIYVDGVEKDSVALGGVSVPDNSHGWTLFGDTSMPCVGHYKHTVSDALKLWFEPNTMLIPTNLSDRSGNGNVGTVNWGSNLVGVEVSVGNLVSYESYQSELVEEGQVPEVHVAPDVSIHEDEEATGSKLPLYPAFNRTADSLGMPTSSLYGLFMIMTGVGLGFGAVIGTGSLLWGGITLLATVGLGTGTGILPMWLPFVLLGLILAMMYLRRTH
jgi:hypothetical protein